MSKKPVRILRNPEVTKKTGLSYSRRWELERAGLFPKSFKLTPGGPPNSAVGWLESEIDAWIAERADQRID